MLKAIKIVSGLAVGLVLFVLAVFVEFSIRSQFGGPMSIDGLPGDGASVTGTWIPDFLGAGKAWKLDIESEYDLELRLDNEIYIIPKGSHEIYSNHDHTNTRQFGNQEFWGYPEKVEVQPLEQKL